MHPFFSRWSWPKSANRPIDIYIKTLPTQKTKADFSIVSKIFIYLFPFPRTFVQQKQHFARWMTCWEELLMLVIMLALMFLFVDSLLSLARVLGSLMHYIQFSEYISRSVSDCTSNARVVVHRNFGMKLLIIYMCIEHQQQQKQFAVFMCTRKCFPS